MKDPNLLEKYILWPLADKIESIRIKMLYRILNGYGMDFGKFGLEELLKMYNRHCDEIERE